MDSWPRDMTLQNHWTCKYDYEENTGKATITKTTG